jgi:hypothetical protein
VRSIIVSGELVDVGYILLQPPMCQRFVKDETEIKDALWEEYLLLRSSEAQQATTTTNTTNTTTTT